MKNPGFKRVSNEKAQQRVYGKKKTLGNGSNLEIKNRWTYVKEQQSNKTIIQGSIEKIK